MCIAYPMKVIKLQGAMAQVAVRGVKARVSVHLIEHVKKGDYVLVHAGIAIEKINQAKAKELLSLFAEIDQKMEAGI